MPRRRSASAYNLAGRALRPARLRRSLNSDLGHCRDNRRAIEGVMRVMRRTKASQHPTSLRLDPMIRHPCSSYASARNTEGRNCGRSPVHGRIRLHIRLISGTPAQNLSEKLICNRHMTDHMRRPDVDVNLAGINKFHVAHMLICLRKPPEIPLSLAWNASPIERAVWSSVTSRRSVFSNFGRLTLRRETAT